MVDDSDEEQENEEVQQKQKKNKPTKPAPVEEKKFNPPPPRAKTKGGDYIVTSINIKDKPVVKRVEGTVSIYDCV